MARSSSPGPSRLSFRVVGDGPFHHPDGVALPGDVLDLDASAAERGISIGRLVEVAPTDHSPAREPGDQE